MLIIERGEYDDSARTRAPSLNKSSYRRTIRVAIDRCSAMPNESRAPQRPCDAAIACSVSANSSRPVGVNRPNESLCSNA